MRQKFKPFRVSVAGFTLVELVVVIVVVAILGGISVTFIKNSVLAYVNSEAYYELADRADVSLRRMSRDIRNALPNSVWVGDGSYVEFVPIKAGGRYKQDTLDFLTANSPPYTFTVLGDMVPIGSGDQLVIYNLGIEGADAYAGNTVRTISGSTASTLTFSGTMFPLPSPANRFYVVNGAVLYVCDLANKRLLMYSNVAIPATPQALPQHPTSFSGLTPSIVAEDVTGCSFTYTEGVMQHSGVVTAQLELSKRGGVVRLLNLINVVNSP
ncbi:MAG: prepilin-type N-terminal cleavage/methylation domain-containing protein [Methylophilus sp.]|uniref:prepilin-type N-terminal cleavage/methylation domain-containing protein n=1 Tax=Methylophilus sp. TaxID=29541 RepID=UPI003F9F8AD8